MSSPGPARLALALAAVAAAALGSACAGGGDEASGRLRVSGSTTLLPMVSAIAERYAAAHPRVELSVEMTGTGDGLALFCDGMVEVAAASRPMTAREREACTASQVQFLQLTVALDAVVLFTPAQSAQPACLSERQIYALIGPESQDVRTWAQASSVIPAAGDGLPEAPLEVIGPGPASGTRRLLIDLAIGPIAEERGRGAALRGDYVVEDSELQIASRLGRTPSGLGFAGLATAAQWGDRVRLIAVDAGGGCTAPDLDAIRAGEYPLGRLLYLYVDVAAARRDDVLRTFIDEVMSERGLATAAAVGSVALSASMAEEQRAAWTRAVTGADG